MPSKKYIPVRSKKYPKKILLLEILLARMKGREVIDVCKVTTAKVEDFDEAMPIVQIRIGKLGVMDVLLNGGFRVNVISKRDRKKIG